MRCCATLGVHHRLEQAVRCQAVGSVHARARHFADRIEVRHDGASAVEVRPADVVNTDASDHVVSGRNDRDGIAAKLQPLVLQPSCDGREFILPWEVEVRGDQVNVGGAEFLHLLVNGSRNDVPRGQ